jgi:diguanylate cyclase (GGDEF)-like protein
LRRRADDGWELWSLRRALLAYVLTVQVLALIVTVLLTSSQRIGVADLVMLAVIVAMGIAKEELTRHVERMRRRFSDTPYQNMTSVWTLAAALVLPAGLAAVVVVALYTHLWIRTWRRVRTTRLWKQMFSVSAVALSCHTATGIEQLIGRSALAETTTPRTVAVLVLVVVAYSVVNLGLVAGAYALMTTDRTARHLLGTLNDALLEFATLAMGVMAAVYLVRSPLLVIFLIPVLIVLHNTVLIRQLEEATSIDPKTGLLNTTAWLALAGHEFDRAKRDTTAIGLLTIDLDQFKRINVTYGDRAGDTVLRAVADAIQQETREDDVVGRHHEEFVVLCPDLTIEDLQGVGERIRMAVERLAVPVVSHSTGDAATVSVTVSIGIAHYPTSATDLGELLVAADIALFAAKDRGRNRVVLKRVDRSREPIQDPSTPSSSA